MKIVITSKGNTLDSEVDPRFGRAACFIVYDAGSGSHEVLDNRQNMNAAQGAGVQAAESVCRTGAEMVLTGDCGPKASAALSSAGIKVVTGISGTVRQAIKDLGSGKPA
jgi:predicted Fe-Mo cluster-binding NifX family protein